MADDHSKTLVTPVAYGYSNAKLPLPPLKEALRPGYFFRLIEYWFFSRVPLRLLLGLPSALVAFAVVLLLFHLRHNDRTSVVRDYQKAVAAAIKQEEWESASLYLKSLCSLQPQVSAHRYQLALLYHQLGNESAAVGLMQQLAPLGDAGGFELAQLWIVKQAAAGQLPEISADELRQRLETAVANRDADPQLNAEANALLADVYASAGLYSRAEERLEIAAARAPELQLALAELRRKLGRDEEEIHDSLETAKNAFEQRMASNPNDVAAFIKYVQCLVHQRRFVEAEKILSERLIEENTPELRVALSDLYVESADFLLRENRLSQVLATRFLVRSLAITPGKANVVAQLSRIPDTKATVSEHDLAAPLEYWRQQLEEGNQPQAILVLAQLLRICGSVDEAIRQLESRVAEHPMLRPMLAQLYVEADRTEKADPLFDELLQELEDHADPSSAQFISARTALLFHARRLEQALTFVRNHRTEVPESGRGPLDRIYVHVLATRADELLAEDDDASAAALDLLEEALSVSTHVQDILIRIAKISCSAQAAAEDADAVLTRMLSQGTYNADVYRLIGTEALLKNQFEKARSHLEKADRLQPNNAMVLNNLALAIIRGPEPDHERALELVERALELTREHPDALGTRAEIYLAMGCWEKADTDLQTALRDRQSNQNLRRLLVLVNEKLGNEDLADEHRNVLSQLQNENR